MPDSRRAIDQMITDSLERLENKIDKFVLPNCAENHKVYDDYLAGQRAIKEVKKNGLNLWIAIPGILLTLLMIGGIVWGSLQTFKTSIISDLRKEIGR
jgi:hypothetical protein